MSKRGVKDAVTVRHAAWTVEASALLGQPACVNVNPCTFEQTPAGPWLDALEELHAYENFRHWLDDDGRVWVEQGTQPPKASACGAQAGSQAVASEDER